MHHMTKERARFAPTWRANARGLLARKPTDRSISPRIRTGSFALDLVTGLTILLAMILNVQIERATSMRGRRGSFGHAVSLVFSIFARRRKERMRS